MYKEKEVNLTIEYMMEILNSKYYNTVYENYTQYLLENDIDPESVGFILEDNVDNFLKSNFIWLQDGDNVYCAKSGGKKFEVIRTVYIKDTEYPLYYYIALLNGSCTEARCIHARFDKDSFENNYSKTREGIYPLELKELDRRRKVIEKLIEKSK